MAAFLLGCGGELAAGWVAKVKSAPSAKPAYLILS
jgi:hypothetical protein